MVRQLISEEEGYIKGLLDAGLSFNQVRNKFNIEYARKLGQGTLARIKNGIRKATLHLPKTQRITSSRDERIICKVIKENRWES